MEWNATKRFDVRASLMVDFSPCDKEYYNTETTGMTKIEPTLGCTFNPIQWFGINIGFMYVAGLGVDGASYTSENISPSNRPHSLPTTVSTPSQSPSVSPSISNSFP